MAVTCLRQEQARLADGVSRVEAVNVVLPVAKNEVPGRIRLSDAAVEFANELRTLDRGKYTIATYENTLRDFQSSRRKEFIDQIDRKDVLSFVSWMRDNLQVRVQGSENRTYKNDVAAAVFQQGLLGNADVLGGFAGGQGSLHYGG
jgi:hypothetical protein